MPFDPPWRFDPLRTIVRIRKDGEDGGGPGGGGGDPGGDVRWAAMSFWILSGAGMFIAFALFDNPSQANAHMAAAAAARNESVGPTVGLPWPESQAEGDVSVEYDGNTYDAASFSVLGAILHEHGIKLYVVVML